MQDMSGRLQEQGFWWAPCRLPGEEYLYQPIQFLLSACPAIIPKSRKDENLQGANSSCLD